MARPRLPIPRPTDVRIVYGEFYRDARIFDVAGQVGIELVHLAPAQAT